MSGMSEKSEIGTSVDVVYPFRVCSVSEKGPVRQQNEDSMVHFDSPFGHVVIVADGMGGHGHGDLAAALVVNGFQESLCQQDPASMPIPDAIRIACSAVNAKIVEMAGSVNHAVMGSTVVMVVLHEADFYVAHVGDSRAYLMRNGSLSRLTRDHSVVQREVDDGLLTEEQAREDSRSSVLTRAMGTPNGENIEIQGPMPLSDGDGILLCSDGLHGFALDRQIEDAIVRNNLDPQKVTMGLVNLAIGTYFSNDNVTVQYIQIGKPRAVNPVRPVFGRAKKSPEPGASHEPVQSARKNKQSLLSKILLWLGCALVVAAGGWVASHPGTARNLQSLRFPTAKRGKAPAQPVPPAVAKVSPAQPEATARALAPLRVEVVLPVKNQSSKIQLSEFTDEAESKFKLLSQGNNRTIDFVLVLNNDVRVPPSKEALQIFRDPGRQSVLQIPKSLNCGKAEVPPGFEAMMVFKKN